MAGSGRGPARPIQRGWDLIYDAKGHPEWWKGVRRSPSSNPATRTVSARYTASSGAARLPYSLEFDLRATRSEPPYLLEAQATGELQGIGRWRLYEGAAGTAAVYDWD